MRDALETWLAAQPRTARQDDVGRQMQQLFASVREDVQRQVQRFMSTITEAANTEELHALSSESIARMQQSGANVSGQLLKFGTTGSGSGVVASYGMGWHPLSGGESHPEALPQKSRPSALLIAFAAGVFVLASLLVFLIRTRKPQNEGALAGNASGAVPALTAVPMTAPGTPATLETAQAQTPPVDTGVPMASAPPSAAPAASSAVKSASPRHAAPTKPSEDPGFLTITAYPWAKVYEGGRVVCPATPCNKLPMSPGAHTLVLENTEQGTRQSATVVIKSGETTTKAVGSK
jgi:serine/threonine-protein kinase